MKMYKATLYPDNSYSIKEEEIKQVDSTHVIHPNGLRSPLELSTSDSKHRYLMTPIDARIYISSLLLLSVTDLTLRLQRLYQEMREDL